MAEVGSTNFFDVVTIGDDLAGLVASALLARRGFRVLLVEHEAVPDRMPLAGCDVPRALLRVTGLESASWRRVIAELNLVQIFRRRVEQHRPSFQTLLPGSRIDASTDAESFMRELDRELATEREGIEAALARAADVSRVLEPLLGQEITLPPDGFWERREMARYDARLPKRGDDLAAALDPGSAGRALLGTPGLFTSALEPTNLGPVPWARALDLWRKGVSHIDGGLGALRQLLIERLRTHAGEVVRADVESLVLKRSKVVGVKLAGKSDAFGANYVIAALPLARLMPLLPTEPPKSLAKAAAAVRIVARRRIVNFVVARTGLPEGIASHVVSVRDPARPLSGANALAMMVEPADEEGRVVVSCEAVFEETDNDPAPTAQSVQTQVMEHVREVMPFVDSHILGVSMPESPPPEGTGTKPTWAPVPPEPVYASDLTQTLGVAAVLHDSGIKHLVIASRENLPGLGLEGDVVSAWSVARMICQAARKKDYLKDAVLQSG